VNIAIWALQGILALIFLAAGVTKTTQPKEKLEPNMGWVADLSLPTVRLIGAVEILGALGLILPAATGIAPVLTPIAATGLALIMVGAIVVHIRRKEPKFILMNVAFGLTAAVIAWARFSGVAA
jgi:uncharacterized membrane protein YphA (DoxX/SURF4 family)